MAEDLSVLTRAARAPDATVVYGPDPDNVADVWMGAESGPRPLIILIHGGFWRPAYDRSHTAPMCEALSARGWPVAAIEYRRVPGHPEITVADVADALRTLAAEIPNDGRVVVMGHSAGGHLALWAASTRPAPSLAGVVALAPAADLRLCEALNLGEGAALAFLGETAADRADLDPARMSSPRMPVTIVHGEADEIVPIRVAVAYVEAHPQAELIRLPGAGHFAVIDPLSAAWAQVIAALASICARTTARTAPGR